ncbi:hypothetical protein [Bacillus massilinigeriensis]|uniref:hypothetical protein n=1 Tax=Bacillus massilionigeriensis TaxID=1805475 RepID=UPI00096B6018|nr:hypothetical protein [Bacillus massilionigeriensis]
MEQNQIASFIIRFHLAEVDETTNEKKWRIKVNHVQSEQETFFESFEEAMKYMKRVVDVP